MKNVVILHRTYPLPGGPATLIKELINRLSDKFKFRVLSLQKGDKVIQIKTKSNIPYLRLIFYHFTSFIILYKLHKKEKIDAILTIGTSTLGGTLFGKIYKIPTITRLSGTRMDLYKRRQCMSIITKLKKMLYWRVLILEFLGYYLSDIIVVPTEYSRKRVIEAYPSLKSKVQVLLEGAQVPKKYLNKYEIRRKYGILGDEKVILFNTYTTTPDIFSESFSRIMNELPKAKVIAIEAHEVKICAGNGVVKTKLTAKEALQLGDVLICAPLFEESHSTLTLESIFLDVPVIAPNIGWFGEEFKNHPIFLFGEVSPEQITNKIIEYYNNREEFEKQTKELKEELLRKYRIDKTIREYEKLLKSMRNR